ncbi:MAG: DUF937 domain-containing protein [Chitinophagaceae bacterium]|nr:MAG: DUF937 domain-containing protein [Chitinophagaceae bacterium]
MSRTASSLGENESGIHKALSGIIPIIFGGVLSRTHSGDASGALDIARGAAQGGLANTLRGLAGGDVQSLISRGMDMVRGLFGTHASALSQAVAGHAGIKESSAGTLLSLAAPVALGKLGEHAVEHNMNASAFSSFMDSHKSDIANALPAGLSLASIPGLSDHRSWGTTTATRTADRPGSTVRADRTVSDVKPGGNRWLWPLLIIGAAVLLWYLLGRGCNNRDTGTRYEDTTTTRTTTPVAMDTARTAAPAGRTSTRVRLANGTEVNAYAGGVEEQLVNCLNDASCKAGKDKWFDFDNINFEVGSATLTAQSQDQVRNIVAILNAYPAAHVKVGGYTDKTGDAAANKKLSQQRADAVLNALKTAGGNAAQLTGAEGYGSEFAKVPATASDEERRQDRRIALQLNAK